MRKVIVLVLIMVLICTNLVYGLDDDYIVRIRVRKARQENEQVVITGSGKFLVQDLSIDNKKDLFEIEKQKINVRIDSYYNQNFKYYNEYVDGVTTGPYHLQINDVVFNTYGEFVNALSGYNELGLDVYPYYNGQGFEVWLGTYVNEEIASQIKGDMQNLGIKTTIIKDDNNRTIIFDETNKIILLYGNNYNVFFSSYDETLLCNAIKIDNKKYRGSIGFYTIEDYKLVTINRLDVEGYLYGVVPNEISAEWPVESIKAQAVAARTYAISNIKPNASYGYDMVDNQNNQVYYGYESEKENSNAAVNDTAGQMLYFAGKLINAYFHSTSGGRTEDSENVWTYLLPYARGVEDEYSNISPYTTWIKNINQQEIISKLKEDGHEVNAIYDIVPMEISNNNRVLLTHVITDKGVIEYKKEKIRSVLGYSLLLSTWFNVDCNNKKSMIYVNNNIENLGEYKSESKLYGKNVISANGVSQIGADDVFLKSTNSLNVSKTFPNEFYFNGRGWGHGIGMSQYGAKQMAIEGFTYEQILKHYYSGVEIKCITK